MACFFSLLTAVAVARAASYGTQRASPVNAHISTCQSDGADLPCLSRTYRTVLYSPMASHRSAVLLLLLLLLGAASARQNLDDLHEEEIVIAPQAYSPRGGRSLSTSTSVAPLRIDVRVGSIDALSSSDQSFLMDQLIPAATSWTTRALAVQPVSGMLRAARFCSSSFSSGTCYSEGSPPTCGVSASGGYLEIPASLLSSLDTCSSCLTNGDCSGCSTAPAGAGVAADFVLILSAVTTTNCAEGGGTLAYAGTCQRDQNDRPIFGYANFCPGSLSAAAAEWDTQLSTAIHELVHALGFSRSSWPLFRDGDGNPRTARGSDGLPPYVDTTCVDGVTRSIRKPSSDTIAIGTERGLTVNRMVTPRVAAVARDIFGCDSLIGAELENQPTSGSACYGSHWEQRLYMNELMAPVDSHVRFSTGIETTCH